MALAIVPAAPADAEQPARDFLPGADLGQRAVRCRIEIDFECLAVRVEWIAGHGRSVSDRQSAADRPGLRRQW